MQRTYVHGSCVCVAGKGVLLQGASGVGKSDLALRLMMHGARLVADDCVCLTADNSQLWASAPRGGRGLLEMRGWGIIRKESLARTRLHLVVQLHKIPPEEETMRSVTPRFTRLMEVNVPQMSLYGFGASAVARVLHGVRYRPVSDDVHVASLS